MPQVQDRSIEMLTCSPTCYHCATAAPRPEISINVSRLIYGEREWERGERRREISRERGREIEREREREKEKERGERENIYTLTLPDLRCQKWVNISNISVCQTITNSLFALNVVTYMIVPVWKGIITLLFKIWSCTFTSYLYYIWQPLKQQADYWSRGRAIEPAPGACFIIKFI